MKILTELTKDELLNRLRRDDPKKYDRRNNYLKDVEALKLYSAIFMAQGILVVPLRVGKYDVRIQISGVMKAIRNQLDAEGQKLPNRNLVYRALRKALDKNDIYVSCSCPDYCIVGDTKIRILDDVPTTVSELCTRFNSGEHLWVYSVDQSCCLIPGKVTDVWVSGRTDVLTKILLDNGKTIQTTPNHKYLMGDGTYKCAEDIKPSDVVRPYFHKVISVTTEHLDIPVDVYDITVDKYQNFFTDAGAILHNCYRERYMATKFKYNFGQPENRPANITNPHNKGSVCKHIAAALSIPSQWLKYVDSWISTVVRAYLEKKLELDFEDIEELIPDEYVKDEIEDITDLGTPDKQGVVPMDDENEEAEEAPEESEDDFDDVTVSEDEIEEEE